MPKTLKIKLADACIGCELCVFEVQRQLKKVGLEGSLLRILRNTPESGKRVEFQIEMDPHINSLDIDKIVKICPKAVFEISEEEVDGFGN